MRFVNALVRLVRREPNTITGVGTAGFNLLVVFEIVDWSDVQIASVNIFAGAVMIMVRQLVKPVAV